jgi:hypothetical protein
MKNSFLRLWKILTNSGEKIEEFDLVEIIKIPKGQKGIVDIGDIGTVLDKYNDKNFEVECGKPDGSYKWLMSLHIRHLKLVSKDPYGIRKEEKSVK